MHLYARCSYGDYCHQKHLEKFSRPRGPGQDDCKWYWWCINHKWWSYYHWPVGDTTSSCKGIIGVFFIFSLIIDFFNYTAPCRISNTVRYASRRWNDVCSYVHSRISCRMNEQFTAFSNIWFYFLDHSSERDEINRAAKDSPNVCYSWVQACEQIGLEVHQGNRLGYYFLFFLLNFIFQEKLVIPTSSLNEENLQCIAKTSLSSKIVSAFAQIFSYNIHNIIFYYIIFILIRDLNYFADLCV